MIDLGTGNNNKINWPLQDKQEFIDIVEVVYRCSVCATRVCVCWCVCSFPGALRVLLLAKAAAMLPGDEMRRMCCRTEGRGKDGVSWCLQKIIQPSTSTETLARRPSRQENRCCGARVQQRWCWWCGLQRRDTTEAGSERGASSPSQPVLRAPFVAPSGNGVPELISSLVVGTSTRVPSVINRAHGVHWQLSAWTQAHFLPDHVGNDR